MECWSGSGWYTPSGVWSSADMVHFASELSWCPPHVHGSLDIGTKRRLSEGGSCVAFWSFTAIIHRLGIVARCMTREVSVMGLHGSNQTISSVSVVLLTKLFYDAKTRMQAVGTSR